MATRGKNLTLPYLRQWWDRSAERQARHLELRQAHTIYLTGNAPTTTVWAAGLIAAALSQAAIYRQRPYLLDAGCGPGRYLDLLSQEAKVETKLAAGLDRNISRLPHPSTRPAGVAYIQADIRQLPFEPGSYGAAMCNQMLNQTGDIARALDQVARVLAPGGLLFVVTADTQAGSWLRLAHETALKNLGFPARLYTPTTSPGQRFNLQNGAGWLQPLFGQVTVELYQRRLAFTSAAALAEYYLSGLMFARSQGFNEPGVAPGQWVALYERVRQQAAQELAHSAALVIQDEAALFQAVRTGG